VTTPSAKILGRDRGKQFPRLVAFVKESNRIENIRREPTPAEIGAHLLLLDLDEITIDDLSAFVWDVARAKLRDQPGMDVMVGGHLPPAGGPDIPFRLRGQLKAISAMQISPWTAHVKYESLHPYLDGNGRSGRALWLWMMTRGARAGARVLHIPERLFLHEFYYQTLDATDT